MVVLLLLAVAIVGVVASRVFANSNFGAVQITDGYSAPQQLLPNAIELISFFSGGAQTVGTKKWGAVNGNVAGTITDVRAYLDTAPTGSSFIVDVLKNGTTIFPTSANRPTIAAGAHASPTAPPDVTSAAAGARITYNAAQIGSTTAGSDLYVSVTIKQACQA